MRASRSAAAVTRAPCSWAAAVRPRKSRIRGTAIEVEREDGAVAVFAVDRGVTYGKDEFPTDEVYGDTDVPELRLITCDGYNAFTREFEENHIVYATLVDVY